MGPRQCGKSSLLIHLGDDYVELIMDDLNLRKLANDDPMGLIDQYSDKKIFIDEAQLAPEIFYAIKRKVDLLKRHKKPRQTIFRLTGSNHILMDKNVKAGSGSLLN